MTRGNLFLFVFCLNLFNNVYCQIDLDPYTVEAGDLGTIIGSFASTIDQPRGYVTFNGIPYANNESYTGQNRFKPPTLVEGPLSGNISEPFLALNVLVFCPQDGILTRNENKQDFRKLFRYPEIFKPPGFEKMPRGQFETKATMGQEDCLHLSINTPKVPKTPEDPLWPVIFFIHGGASTSVWGSLWNGGRLLQHDVVLVSINYRLSIFGSLNLGIDAAPGNGAMYDALTALKFVNKYIQYFGGDPNKVTIAGHSAGAMMVSHLLLSPMAKGLFHGVIGHSGSALAVWGTSRQPSLPMHLRIAEFANCYDSTQPGDPDLEAIAQCMIDAPTDLLLDAEGRAHNEQERSGEGIGFDGKVPSVQDSELITIEKFLPKHPIEILRAGEQSNVPLFIGSTKHDGSFSLSGMYYSFIVHHDLHNNATWLKDGLFPALAKAMGMPNADPIMLNALAKTYLGDTKDLGEFNPKIPGLIDIITILGMKGGSYEIVEKHSRIQPKCYTYTFDFQGMWPLADFTMNTDLIPGGVAHIDDMMYLFQFLPLLTQRDIEVSRRLVQYWVNFAYTGNPNGDVEPEDEFWPRYNPIDHPYLVIDKEDYVKHNFKDSWAGQSLDIIWKPINPAPAE